MATDLERLVVRLDADLNRFTREMQRANGVANRQMRAIEQRFLSTTAVMDRFGGNIARSIIAPLTGIGAALSVNAIIGYADAWTKAKNALAVAGVVGGRQADLLERLYEQAQKNAAPLNAVVELYGRAAQASANLGASQDQLVQLTDAVGLALRVSGQSAEGASGALRQLGQALSGNKVQAEEFNSLVDGLYPLLQAAASGSDRWRGSVAALTADVKAGKVSAQEFFRAILAGADSLRDRAANATETLGQAFTRVGNALERYVGQTDETLGGTQRLVQALDFLADHLAQIADVALQVAAVIAGALIARALVALGVQLVTVGTALVRFVAALRTAQIAAIGFQAALGPISLVLGAMAAGLWLMAGAQDDAASAGDVHRQSIEQLNAEVDHAKGQTREYIAGLIKEKEAALQAAEANVTLMMARVRAAQQPGVGSVDELNRRIQGGDIFGGAALDPTQRGPLTDLELQLNRSIIDAMALQEAIDKLRKEEVTAPSVNDLGGTRPGTSSGAGKKAKEDAYQREVRRIEERTRALQNERETIGLSAREAEKARTAFELLEAAKEAGIPINDRLRASIDRLAGAYAEATVQLEAARKAQQDFEAAVAEFKSTAADVLKGFISDLRQGKTAGEALNNVLDKITDTLLNIAINKLVEAAFGGLTGGGGFVGKLIGGLFGGAGPATGGGGGAATASASATSLPTIPSAAAVSVGVTVEQHVHNNAGVQVRQEQSRTPSGGIRIDTFIDQAVGRAIATPGSPADQALRKRFGLSPALIRR